MLRKHPNHLASIGDHLCWQDNSTSGGASEPMEFPPTCASGYGVMTETDMKKPNLEVLKDHEAKIISWATSADSRTLNMAVKTASNHSLFPDFSRSLHDYKFGTYPADDVIKFDMWLKKMELSNAAPEATTPQTGPAYWQKFVRKNAVSSITSASTTPSRSPSERATPSPVPTDTSAPDSETTISSVKRKLDLGGCSIGGGWLTNHDIP